MDTAPPGEKWSPAAIVLWHDLIRERSGLYFDPNRIGKLLEAVDDRQAALVCSSLADYWLRLHADPGEMETLISLLTVNETYFFRGIEELQVFADSLLPEFWHGLAGARPVSIVSAGCSSGEEAYSIAMMVLERQGNGIPFLVHGGDVDGHALATARAALYGENAFRNFDESLRRRYFSQEAAGKERVVAHLQEKVDFFSLNLVADRYPPPMQGADFVFYRNVSIYFDELTKKKIFSHLLEHLTPGGCLFLSPAEIFFHNLPDVMPRRVRLEDRHGRFFFRKLLEPPANGPGGGAFDSSPAANKPDLSKWPRVAERDLPDARHRRPAPVLERSEQQDLEKSLAKAVRLANEQQFRRALARLDPILREHPDHCQAATLKAAILLHGGDDRATVSAAQKLCQGVLAKDSLCFAALVLLAMALHQEGVAPQERMARLKAAIFLNPSSWLPHFYLAQTCELLDEQTMAVREYQVVIHRLSQTTAWAEHGLSFLPLSFSADELIGFCQFRLRQMHPS
ncbi:MAG: protein-glutamate O-methyltransferase CheR [Magnetococcus sp. MYC-9]